MVPEGRVLLRPDPSVRAMWEIHPTVGEMHARRPTAVELVGYSVSVGASSRGSPDGQDRQVGYPSCGHLHSLASASLFESRPQGGNMDAGVGVR